MFSTRQSIRAALVCFPLGLSSVSYAATSLIANGDFETFTNSTTPASWTKSLTVTATQTTGLSGTGSAAVLGLSGVNASSALVQNTSTTIGPNTSFSYSMDFSQSSNTGREMNITLRQAATTVLNFAVFDGVLQATSGTTFGNISAFVLSAGTAYHLDVTGNLGSGGTYSVTLYALYDPGTVLISATNVNRWQTTPTSTTTFTAVNLERGRSGSDWTVDNVSIIPEPGSLMLIGSGFLGCFLRRRR